MSPPGKLRVQACAFDAYGTLLDVHSAVATAGRGLGERGAALSETWRRTQLQYTWLRSLMRRHRDFASVTADMVDDLAAGGVTSVAMGDAVDEHTIGNTFDMVGVAMNLGGATYRNPAADHALGRCIVCHMPQTARAASWIVDDEGFAIRGDIASHTFRTISPDTSELMALSGVDPVPSSCVDCHRGFPRGGWRPKSDR